MFTRRRHLLGLIAVGFACTLALSRADAQTFTDPEKAGVDFTIQGEYEGLVETDAGKQKYAAQIIASGDGKFQIVGYKGGLPGAGWNRGDEKKAGKGELQGDTAVFTVEEATIKVAGGVLSVFVEDEKVAELKKVERKSPTLGAKPPKGAVVLFDGTSADNFDEGKLVEDKYLGATGCSSKQKFSDHTLHLEFRTPFMPKARGQGRGNSGMYVQSRYEVQVLDSFGLEGKSNECGGIYSISEPAVNMCLPPLSWQTYDYEFTAARYNEDGEKTKNARITLKHNGVVIHDDIELTKGTPGRHPEGPGPDGLFLQHHGNPVVFRNIWVVEKK